MYLGELIKKYRATHKLSMEEFGQLIGKSKAYISMLEKNKNSRSGKPIAPSMQTFQAVANVLHISLDELLLSLDENQPIQINTSRPTPTPDKSVRIPVLGYVVAGVPISAVQDILGYEEISKDLSLTGEFFALCIKGASMEPQFFEGDIVIVRQQSDVDDNDIAIVLVNGDEATVKQIKKSDAGITLIGFNVTVYPPHFYSNKDIEELPVSIIGKVVELRRSF